ncbi:MAG: DNA/RNA nuclease SfsA [Candidatus Helarchaeota archaeon]
MLISKNIEDATFIKRYNKYLGLVKTENKEVQCFIPNPGRMKELLVRNNKVYVNSIEKKDRKTGFDLVAVNLGGKIVSIDSRVPNKFVLQLLKNKGLFSQQFDEIRPEYTYKNSRFDFYLKSNTTEYLVEVKSCTLVKDKVALFPDAPTKRGARHVHELTQAIDDGYKSVIIFFIQRDDADFFSPNKETDKLFSDNLKKAQNEGVNIIALANKIFISGKKLFIEPLKEVQLKF